MIEQGDNIAHTAHAASSFDYWLAAGIFAVAFALIISEKMHKTKVALLGGALMLGFQIVTQAEAFHSERLGIDYNVVFLLISMMILVNIMGQSGIFQWVAVKCAKLARGRPFSIMVIFIVLTAVASAFLDNVTTVLLLAPVTLLIADELDIDPIPFLLAETLASNIGGTATLIGDPPNIIIGSRANLTFMDFVVNLAPAVLVMLAGFLVAAKIVFGKKIRVDEQKRLRIMEMDESKVIKDVPLARKSVIVLALTLVGFVLHGALHLEPATVALIGAAVLLAISRGEPHNVLAKVEWGTVFFFIGLFIMVGAIVKVGLIGDISRYLIEATEPTDQGMYGLSIVLLWGSAVLSAVVDNIPYVATMSPLVLDTASAVFHGGAVDAADLPLETLHHPVLQPVWWALALGSCLGGNATPIGASANVIVLGIAERAGVIITFLRFMAYGVPTMLITVGISHVYLWLRYF